MKSFIASLTFSFNLLLSSSTLWAASWVKVDDFQSYILEVNPNSIEKIDKGIYRVATRIVRTNPNAPGILSPKITANVDELNTTLEADCLHGGTKLAGFYGLDVNGNRVVHLDSSETPVYKKIEKDSPYYQAWMYVCVATLLEEHKAK